MGYLWSGECNHHSFFSICFSVKLATKKLLWSSKNCLNEFFFFWSGVYSFSFLGGLRPPRPPRRGLCPLLPRQGLPPLDPAQPFSRTFAIKHFPHTVLKNFVRNTCGRNFHTRVIYVHSWPVPVTRAVWSHSCYALVRSTGTRSRHFRPLLHVNHHSCGKSPFPHLLRK